MRICLVSMPWHSIDCPSLAVGVLHRLIENEHEVVDVYGSVRWADYALARSGGVITPAIYTRIAEEGIFEGLGDWIFAPALLDRANGDEPYVEHIRRVLAEDLVDHAVYLRGQSVEFVHALADQIAAIDADLIGFTTTFMQNVPALSVAKRLREIGTPARIVFGGANCDGPMGAAIHRNYPVVDYVVRGEGERVFPALLDALEGSGDLGAIPGLCWRDADGVPQANPMSTETVEIVEVPPPNFDCYFAELEQSPIQEFVEPKLVVEAARGCWWGAKQHCTFCGLNGTTMSFRSKPAEQAWQEISELISRHQVLDVIAVDNIMDMRYFRDFLPLLADSDWDLRVHYEVKSNLSSAQIRLLADAHVTHIQPGIESLSSNVLKLMKKGVSGCQNVQLLRDCEQHNLTVSWNYLYGFPGESPTDYGSIVDQLELLVHLQPPAGASRIGLQRFSPYFDDRDLGFADRVPAYFYRYLYEVSDSDMEDLAFLFEGEDRGITGDPQDRLSAAVSAWRDRYAGAFLDYVATDGELRFRDGRNGAVRETTYDSQLAVEMYRSLQTAQSRSSLARDLEKRGIDAPGEEVDDLLQRFADDGVVFSENGRTVAIALEPAPRRIKNFN